MLTCREVIEFLMNYAEGNVTPEERVRFEEHLAVCPACVNYLNTYRTTVRLSQQAFEPLPSDAGEARIPDDLVKAILDARRK